MNEEKFFKSHTFKLFLMWFVFALAILGTYALSHQIENRSNNLATVFFSNGQEHEVDIYAGYADPVSIEINKGDTVIFLIKDDSHHDIAEARKNRNDARLDSGELGKGESYSLTFKKSGNFSFYDRMNQDININVVIK